MGPSPNRECPALKATEAETSRDHDVAKPRFGGVPSRRRPAALRSPPSPLRSGAVQSTPEQPYSPVPTTGTRCGLMEMRVPKATFLRAQKSLLIVICVSSGASPTLECVQSYLPCPLMLLPSGQRSILGGQIRNAGYQPRSNELHRKGW